MEAEGGASVTTEIETPNYHVELAEYLQRTEPELWRWFEESSHVRDRNNDEAELALLKSAYRLDGGAHDVLVGYATLLADRFGLDEKVVLYQQLGTGERNARVFRLNEQIHVVFSGDLLDLLTSDEQHAVLAHELAHIALWERDEGTYLVLDHLVHRLASEQGASDALIETARRLRLHTEVWADAAATTMVDDVETVVAAVVKVNAGLRHVDATAYLRQAAQILERDSGASESWSHPELHIRVACIEARERESSSELINALVSGKDDLDRLDLLGQVRMQELTRRVLATGRSAIPSSSGADTYLRSYPDLDVTGAQPLPVGELTDHEPSVRWMSAAILVDLVLADGATDTLDEVRGVSAAAERLGVATEFDKILGRATDRSTAEAARLREDAS